MAFQFDQEYKETLNYNKNALSVFKFPRGNIFTGMELLLSAKVNVTGVSSNAPDFQIFNLIDTVQLVRDSKNIVWNISGKALALYFTNGLRYGLPAAAGNALIAGAIANAVTGQHYLNCSFAPFDAPKQGEFGCDTRGHSYELRIKWADATQAGILFGTVGGITVVQNSDITLDIQLNQVNLINNPTNGQPDSLTLRQNGSSPALMMGLIETVDAIAQANPKFPRDVPNNMSYRDIILWTTDTPNANQEVGVSTILNNEITLQDSQGDVKMAPKASMVHQRTSQNWGLGTGVNAGVYDLQLLPYGSSMDVYVDSAVQDLGLVLDVNAGTAAQVRTIFVTQQTQ